MARKKKPDEPLERRAFDLPRLTLSHFARAAKRSLESIKSYRDGRREMPPDVRKRLADFLEEHGKKVIELAKDLRKSAK